MERSHTPLSTWFWAAYLVASQTQGMSAVQFQRQLGLTRYETAFQILHKLRAGMVRPHQDRIGGRANEHVEVDETWIGGRTRGEGRGVHHKVLVACAVEVRHRKPGTARDKRNDGRYAGRVRLAVAADRSAKSLCGFVDGAVAPGTLIVTDDWSGYADLRKRGYDHHAIAECGGSEVTDEFLPIIHLVFANLKTWLTGIHHGVSERHLQAYLNEFTFRFNRRFYPFNAFRSLLGIASDAKAPTYAQLYSGDWNHLGAKRKRMTRRHRTIGQRPLDTALDGLMVRAHGPPYRKKRRVVPVSQQHPRPLDPTRRFCSRSRNRTQCRQILLANRHFNRLPPPRHNLKPRFRIKSKKAKRHVGKNESRTYMIGSNESMN